MMLSMVVVLPAPLRPTRQTTSWLRTLNETRCRMCAGPRKAWMFFTSSMSNVRPEQVLGHVAVLADLLGRTVVEELALALREPSRAPLRLAAKAELAEQIRRFAGHRGIALRERKNPPGLAF